MPSGIGEFDRVLGGGIVPGSMVLIGGEPGIGKSTLLLQVAHLLGRTHGAVLYVSGEESERQIKLRGERLGIAGGGLFLLAETSLERILEHVETLKPAALVVDSVQTMYSAKFPSAPGSISQVREVATQLLFLAKGRGITTFLIGHVTKDGNLAGPEVARAHRRHRPLLRGREAAAPPHRARGQEPLRRGLGAGRVRDDRRPACSRCRTRRRCSWPSGSQARRARRWWRRSRARARCWSRCRRSSRRRSFGTPRRMALGLDPNRTNLLLAVLEKRVGLELLGDDVFVSVAGGLEVTEPAADLGVAAAIASSFRNRAAPRAHGGVRRGRAGGRGARRRPGRACASARPRRWASRAASCPRATCPTIRRPASSWSGVAASKRRSSGCRRAEPPAAAFRA